ncbi:hypothetical protein BC830DRAFT_782871 [Chytriomyces sp. MP71]|nr:hypothetical protein BC830DRAFT_782871 [Chytriomyces sp. MP71]
MDRHFDRIPDEILWAILQWVQPHVPLMSLGSEASMIRASAPSDPSDEDPVRLTAMRWRGFDAISEGNAGESIPTPPLETLLSGVCRRWRRLSFSLRNDWAAFDPTILFSGQMDNVFTHAFSAMLHDSARLSALRHFAPRLFGAAEGLAKKHAELLLRKIKPAQLHTFDVAFGVDVLHKAPQLVTKCLDWFLRGAVDTLGLESFRLTSLSIEWSLEENPHHERIRPQIANLMAKAPRLCHICIYNAPNKILEQVKGSGGFTKTLKSLLFSANTTFAEPVKLDILSHAIASNCLETLVLDEGFEGELSLGVDSLKELTISRTSFIDEDWREPVWTFDILELLPLAARQQIKTLRILFPSDT